MFSWGQKPKFAGKSNRLHVENLGDRTMPSATVSFDPLLQTVTIQGDAATNVAEVRVQSGQLAVTADGVTSNFQANRVRTIVFVGADGDDQFTNLTNIRSTAFGSAGIDVLNGGTNRDDLYGGLGNDQVFGLAGEDRLFGGDGNDLVEGGAGKDKIQGDGGDDMLLGGDGDDEIRGGQGSDTIDGGAGADRIRANANDVILNLQSIDRVQRDDDPANHS